MLTMFNDAKNFPEYRLFIFIRGCVWLAVCYQPEYLFLNGWFSSIFQGNPEARIFTQICNKSVSVLQIYLSNSDLYESEINEVMIQSMNPKITVMKYEINPRSEKGISLGKVEGCVINNKGIQIYNKENSYKGFLSNYVKHMT